MGDVELDGATAKRLEVYEQQTLLCPEQVAWMRLTMQQPLARFVGRAMLFLRASEAW